MSLFKSFNSPQFLWLFDFDLTLYDFEESSVLYSMDRPMNEFIVQSLNLSPIEANLLRKRFWKEYGTTLAGLRKEFNVDPHDFFNFIHSHQDIIHPKLNPKLDLILAEIQSEKWVFTNGRRDWAEIGLKKIGIEKHFTKIFDLSDSEWLGKPHLPAYERVVQEMQEGQQVLFLDDNKANILTAQSLGWHTIWMRPDVDFDDSMGLQLSSILELEDQL